MKADEARVILGDEASAELTDEQLQQLIWDLEVIARDTLRAIREAKFKQYSQTNP